MRFLKKLVATGLTVGIAAASAYAQPITDAQGDVGIGTFTPHPSAKLDLTSTSKGFLVPRMTTAQRDAIAGPADALLIFNTTTRQFEYYDANLPGWTAFPGGAGPYWRLDGNDITAEWNGATGQHIGTNNAHDLSITTLLNQNIDIWTNNTQVAIVTGGGDVGIGQLAPSARLDVVGDNANPAIEATNTGVVGVESTVDGGSGLILGSYPAVHGDGNGETGVAGTSNNGVGVFGASNLNHGVNGLGLAGGTAGVFGRNDAATGFGVIGTSVGNGTGVFGNSTGGIAGRFENTNAGNPNNTLLVDNNGAGNAVQINATGGGVGIDLNGGELDGDDQGNALGDGSANQQLTVRGAADAVIGNTLAGNPTVWDLVVDGDAVSTGLIKAGGSIWIDGVTPGNHQVVANDVLNVGTLGTDNLTLSTNGANAVVVDGTTQDVNILNDLDVDGNGNVNGTMNVDGATTLNSTLDVDGVTDLHSNLNVDGPTDLNSTLNVDGASTFNNTINQTGGGQVTFSGNVDATNGVDVSGADLNVALNANITGNTNVGGNTQVTGDLNVDGITTLDETTVEGTLDQVGGAQVTFSGNVDANNGLDVAGADLNVATNANITGNTQVTGDLNVDGITTLDETTVEGTLDQVGGAQVTFSGNVDANNGLDVAGADLNVATNANITGNLVVNGTSDLQGNVFNSTGDVTVDDHVVPAADATYDLGTNANRWRDIYVDGASVHIGDAIGTEMTLGYTGGVGTINVNGAGSPQIQVDGAGAITRFDPNGDGTLNAFVRADGIGINTGVGTDILIAQDGIQRNGGANESFTFSNTGGVLDLTTTGDMNVGEVLTVTGTTNANGVLNANSTFNANATGNTIGDGTDAEQLQIDGVDGGVVDVDINGDVDISGTLTVGSFTLPPLTSDLDLNGNNIVDNVDGIVTADDNFNVTGGTDLDGTLNVDGAAVMQSTLSVMGNTILDANTTVNGNATLNGAVVLNGTSTFNATSTWSGGNNITLSNGTLTANKTAAGSAVAINNTNGTNAIAVNVAAGGGRTILSYGTGAGVIPTDVSIWNATGNVTLPGSVENGQVLYVVNTSGAAITVTGVTGGTAAGFNNNDVRGYVYAAGWFELP